ncbi:MAG: hypothetical protein NTX30_02425, partial [Deltaproteobacteria bacterium]|nr:hypothetical protein [Deltaproteobacteria bacterium]
MSRTSIDLKRALTADAFLRTSGAPLVRGNSLRILRDGSENYPEWMKAIESAEKTIHLEMYIIHNDQTGRRFRDLMVEKARQGVKVRVLYDWVGSGGPLAYRMWKGQPGSSKAAHHRRLVGFHLRAVHGGCLGRRPGPGDRPLEGHGGGDPRAGRGRRGSFLCRSLEEG